MTITACLVFGEFAPLKQDFYGAEKSLIFGEYCMDLPGDETISVLVRNALSER